MSNRIPDGGLRHGREALLPKEILRQAQSLRPMLPIINEVYRLIGVPTVLTNQDLENPAGVLRVLEAVAQLGHFLVFLAIFLSEAEGISFAARQEMRQMRAIPACGRFEAALRDPSRSQQLFSAWPDRTSHPGTRSVF